jgi:hypothetical protein
MKVLIHPNAQQQQLDVIDLMWIKGPLLTYIWNGCYLPINMFCQPLVRFTKYIWMIALVIIIAINFPRNDLNMSIRILSCENSNDIDKIIFWLIGYWRKNPIKTITLVKSRLGFGFHHNHLNMTFSRFCFYWFRKNNVLFWPTTYWL